MKANTCIIEGDTLAKKETTEALLFAARDLFSQRGYNAVTTKEIAARADVNEVTLFRHFQSKQKLFEAVFEHFNFRPNMDFDINSFENRPWEFLVKLGQSLYKIFQNNLSIIKIELKNEITLENQSLPLKKFPNELKELICHYFRNNSQMDEEALELFAVNFLSSVFGLFLQIHILKTFKPTPDFNKCLEKLVSDLLK